MEQTTSREPTIPAVDRRLPIRGTVLAAIWLGMLLVGASDPEQAFLAAAHVSERPWVIPVLVATRLGDWEILVALPFLGAALLLYRRQHQLALFLLGSALVGRLLVSIQKGVLGRLRPEQDEPLITVETLAYPSGHAANSMIVYLLLALLLVKDPGQRRLAVAAAVVASLLIGASRVLLGVHWPSDVIGGWAFGLLWVLLCLRIGRRWLGRE